MTDNYSALRHPLSERLPIVTYTNLVWPVAETVWMSPQVERLTGYCLHEWVGHPGFFESILHPDRPRGRSRRGPREPLRAARPEPGLPADRP